MSVWWGYHPNSKWHCSSTLCRSVSIIFWTMQGLRRFLNRVVYECGTMMCVNCHKVLLLPIQLMLFECMRQVKDIMNCYWPARVENWSTSYESGFWWTTKTGFTVTWSLHKFVFSHTFKELQWLEQNNRCDLSFPELTLKTVQFFFDITSLSIW